ncbi:unnamed protein product [Rotaria sordida]|uniref:Uncharacterized protein n=1 Tax=Rotaria sordida TaxID=392033 RepID=A0A813P1U3_9BILA|nr:unnamed protein product [Rotaria sordida]CAF1438712.1 unnamed protein product [Rotaria sordida]
MSLNSIKDTIGELIGINVDTFEIQVKDECFKDIFVLDDEYLKELHERLPRTSISHLFGSILLNPFSSDCYDLDRCEKEAKSNDSTQGLLFGWNTIDNENETAEEINLIHDQEDKPSNPEEWFVSTPAEGNADICQLHEFDYSFNSASSLIDVNQIDLLSSNDDIKRHICDSDMSITESISETLFPSDGNELDFTKNMNHEAQTTVQNSVDTVVKQPVSIEAIPVGTSCTSYYEQNSDDLNLHLPDQIAQPTIFVALSTSLQFVHDVHPYQKTQYDTDISDEFIDKSRSPYVMRIQGIKTIADKGKNILPRIKIPKVYTSINQQLVKPLYLMVAVVREKKVNDKRILYPCEDIQFLPARTNKNIEAVNPIQLNLNSLPIESDGTFQLSLRLINKSVPSPSDQSKSKLFYQLDEDIVKTLHPAPYDPRFIRLVCTLVQNDRIAWNTLCLSDYIRPKQELQT